MTTGEAARLAPVEHARDTADDVLARLRDSALGLLAGLDRPPSSLRIKADQVEIELRWPEPVPPPGPYLVAQPGAVAQLGAAAQLGPAAAVGGGGAAAVTERYVTAHMVGVFYRSPEPGAQPFVAVGDVIRPGQQVGTIEAMKLMIPVEADVAGRVVEVLVADGASVEYGDRLVAVQPPDS